ncbi:cobalamin biosynthesis protein, partial [Mycobacterium tuberculosis]|uniref:cobalamin biosynthesis protein n=1 Tax=Mycobacterium tuberculosis TaxID=1773 RepID=UPI001F1D5F40
GVPAVLGYRAINTLDSMIGYRSPRYLRFGWAAARLDDWANYVGARATAVPAGQPYPRVALGVAAMPGSSMATAAPAAAEPGGHRAPTAGPAARPGCSATAGKAAMAARWAATAATVATPS